MDKIKGMMHGGHKKEGEPEVHATPAATTATGGDYGQPGIAQTTEGGHEKKGLFGGLGGHHKEGEEGKKKSGFMGMGGGSSSSSSSSDEEREGARERNRLRREKRAQRKAGTTTSTGTGTGMATGTAPVEGGEKKHGFFG